MYPFDRVSSPSGDTLRNTAAEAQTTTTTTTTTTTKAQGDDLIHLQILKFQLEKLIPAYGSLFFLPLEHLCDLILIDTFLSMIQFFIHRAELYEAFQTFSELMTDKKWRNSDSNIKHFLIEALPRQLQLPTEMIKKFSLNINAIIGISKLKIGENSQKSPVELIEAFKLCNPEEGVKKILFLQKELFTAWKSILPPTKKYFTSQIKNFQISLESYNRTDVKLEEIPQDAELTKFTKNQIVRMLYSVSIRSESLLHLQNAILALSETNPSVESVIWLKGLLARNKDKVENILQDSDIYELIKSVVGVNYCITQTKFTEESHSYFKLYYREMLDGVLVYFSYLACSFKRMYEVVKEQPTNKKNSDLLIYLVQFYDSCISGDRRMEELEKELSTEFQWFKEFIGEHVQLCERLIESLHNRIIDEFKKNSCSKMRDVLNKCSLNSLYTNFFYTFLRNAVIPINSRIHLLVKNDVSSQRDFIKEASNIFFNIANMIKNNFEYELANSERFFKSRINERLKFPEFCDMRARNQEIENLGILIKRFEQSFHLTFCHLIPCHEASLFHLRSYHLNTEELLLELIEQEHFDKSKRSPKKENVKEKLILTSSSSSSESISSEELTYSDASSAKSLPTDLKTKLLPFHFRQMKEVIRLPGKDLKRICHFDAGFHLTQLENYLDLAEELIKNSDLNLLKLVSQGMANNYYHILEQMAEYFCSNPNHSLVKIFEELKIDSRTVKNLDKYTLWYRYPHQSALFYPDFPLGLKLIFEDNPRNLPQCLHDLTDLSLNKLCCPQNNLETEFVSLEKTIQEKLDLLKFMNIEERKDYISTSLSSRMKEIEERILLKFNEGYFADKPANLRVCFKDFHTHLERLSLSLELLEKYPYSRFLGIITHQILMSSQYVVELYFTILSIQEEEFVRTHNLKSYLTLFNGDKRFSPTTEKFILNYLNLKKGSDYPYRTYYMYQGKVNSGMKLLSLSFLVSSEEGGFIPVGLSQNSDAQVRSKLSEIVQGMFVLLEEMIY